MEHINLSHPGNVTLLKYRISCELWNLIFYSIEIFSLNESNDINWNFTLDINGLKKSKMSFEDEWKLLFKVMMI